MTLKEILLAAALVIVTLFGIQEWRNTVELKKQYANSLSINDSTKRVMKLITDENGQLHGRVETAEVDKTVYEATHKAYVDSITKALGIKPKNLNSITKVSSDNNGSFTTAIDTTHRESDIIKGKDTIKTIVNVLNFNYDSDKWLQFAGKIDSGKLFVDYKYRDSLTLTTFTKKTGFLNLGPTKTFADVKSENPNTSYNSMSSIELTNIKPKHWSVGPYVGYGYNGLKWSPQIGISLQRILFKF